MQIRDFNSATQQLTYGYPNRPVQQPRYNDQVYRADIDRPVTQNQHPNLEYEHEELVSDLSSQRDI